MIVGCLPLFLVTLVLAGDSTKEKNVISTAVTELLRGSSLS